MAPSVAAVLAGAGCEAVADLRVALLPPLLPGS